MDSSSALRRDTWPILATAKIQRLSLGLLLLARLLLAGHGLLLALAGPRVRLRPLTVDRQALAVPDALVTADLDLAPDVGLNFATEVTLDLVVRLDVVTHGHELGVGELVHAKI